MPGGAWRVAVVGNYAYVISGWQGYVSERELYIVDVSTPECPTVVGSYDPPGSALGVAVAGDYAYVAAGSGGLRVVDVSTPSSPTEGRSYATAGCTTHGVAVEGDRLYVTSCCIGDYLGYLDPVLYVYDVSTPGRPTCVDRYGLPAHKWSCTDVLAVAGDWVYFAVHDRDTWDLCAADVSTAWDAVYFSETKYPVYDLVAVGNYACVAAGDEGLRVIDLSMPQYPAVVGSYGTLASAADVAVAGDYAYVGHTTLGSGFVWRGELGIIDVSRPESPARVGGCCGVNYSTMSPHQEVAVSGDYAYVINGRGLDVVDVSDPISATRVGGWSPISASHFLEEVALTRDYAYIADSWDDVGLHIIDVSTPESPTEVGSWPGHVSAVAVAENYAYVTNAYEEGRGLHVIPRLSPPPRGGSTTRRRRQIAWRWRGTTPTSRPVRAVCVLWTSPILLCQSRSALAIRWEIPMAWPWRGATPSSSVVSGVTHQ